MEAVIDTSKFDVSLSFICAALPVFMNPLLYSVLLIRCDYDPYPDDAHKDVTLANSSILYVHGLRLIGVLKLRRFSCMMLLPYLYREEVCSVDMALVSRVGTYLLVGIFSIEL